LLHLGSLSGILPSLKFTLAVPPYPSPAALPCKAPTLRLLEPGFSHTGECSTFRFAIQSDMCLVPWKATYTAWEASPITYLQQQQQKQQQEHQRKAQLVSRNMCKGAQKRSFRSYVCSEANVSGDVCVVLGLKPAAVSAKLFA
jgi:hypothetical protein